MKLTSYLSQRREWINLIFPLIALPFIFAEYKLGWGLSIAFFIAISHFGALHHLVTIYIVGQSPECISWSEKYFGSVSKFFIALAFLGIALFFTFVFSMQRLETQFPFMKWVFMAFILFDIYFVSTFHMIHQSKGMSLLYNKFGKTSENVKKYEQWERRCATGLVTGVVLAGFFGTFRRNPLGVSQYSFSKPLEMIGFTLASLSALGYIYAGIKSSLQLKSTKGIFTLRMLLWIFYPISAIAQGTQRLVHGLEYYLVYAKIKDSRKDLISLVVLLSAVILVTSYAVILSFRNDGLAVYLGNTGFIKSGMNDQYLGQFKIRTLAYAAYGTLNMLHILLDSFLFRYKYQEAREATLKHLLK